ncbi:ribosomal protein L15, partial [Meredithblackwellia eburnea MCA 4105]
VSHLGNLSPAPGSSHKRKRIGRGIGSGRGGTSGRGHKGQGARSGNGKPQLHFAGGQTPITRAFPKRGFTNPLRQEMTPLNLDRLQHWIDLGLLDPSKPITMKELFESKCVHGIKHGVKLLADGKEAFTTPNVNLLVSRASQSAIKAIEEQSGTVVARYENRLTLRALINPSSFARRGLDLPGKADPVKRRDLLYYSDPKHRGYL